VGEAAEETRPARGRQSWSASAPGVPMSVPASPVVGFLDVYSAHDSPASVLEPLAAGDPQLECGKNHGEDAEARLPSRRRSRSGPLRLLLKAVKLMTEREDLAGRGSARPGWAS